MIVTAKLRVVILAVGLAAAIVAGWIALAGRPAADNGIANTSARHGAHHGAAASAVD